MRQTVEISCEKIWHFNRRLLEWYLGLHVPINMELMESTCLVTQRASCDSHNDECLVQRVTWRGNCCRVKEEAIFASAVTPPSSRPWRVLWLHFARLWHHHAGRLCPQSNFCTRTSFFPDHTHTGVNSTLFYIVVGSRDFVCHSYSYGLRAIIQCLPAWLRFIQCLRRYRDTKRAFPHLVNAGKYSTTFFVVTFAALYATHEGRRRDW